MNEAQMSDSAMPRGNVSGIVTSALLWWTMLVVYLSFAQMPVAQADCWLIEGEKGFVWLAICSQNQPPYESIPLHINSTIVDLRLNENKIRSIHFSSLSRFSNLTYLNLTKNDISYIEDGAFSAQFNLQVLQIGFNKLRNLTEGMLRGLGRLQYLYLQANQIESVSPNAFWECPAIENIDLSMNRIQQLDGNTFHGLSKLTTCELYLNPFSCSCELLGFLRWFAAFPNKTSERMVCDTPDGFSGYSLLSQNPRMQTSRSAFRALSTVCDDHVTPYFIGSSDGSTPTILPDLTPCGLEDCPSGTLPDETISFSPTYFDPDARELIRLKELTHTSAVITVQIPKPFSRMYSLALYNNSFYLDIQALLKQRQDIQLLNLRSHTNYTYCVVSVRFSLRYNHTCLTIFTSNTATRQNAPKDSTATHYIMTILGCFFGMLIVLGVVYHCLRKRKQHDDPKSKKLEKMKRNLIEMKYGADLESGSQLSQKQMMPAPEVLQRMPYLQAPSETDQYKVQEMLGTPKATKGNYIEVRSDQSERLIESAPPSENSQGSVAEISTIAKEVDKVNQIINNCIDALKSESSSFQAVKSGAVSTAEPQLVLISEHTPGKSGLLSPVYKGYHHPLQRHHSMEAPLKRTSTSSTGSIRSPRSFRSDGAYRSESKYIEKSSLDESGILTVAPAAAILKSEAERMRHYSEHRHSYPGPHHVEEPLEVSASRKSSVFEPLTHSRACELSYSQLSPQYHNLSGYSSPEYGCRPSLSLWERFKLHRKRHRDEDEYMAAGYALRRKVQFAKDEDLHDILDYWKGVSAQQKL